MNLTLTLFISGILVTFPLLVYNFFVVYIQNMKKEKLNILLSLAILFSLYLVMSYKTYIPLIYQFGSIIIPVIIAYLNNKPKLAFLMSIIITEYLIREIDYNIITLIIFFLSIFISFKSYIKTNKSPNFLINLSIIGITITFIVNELEHIIKDKEILINVFFAVLSYAIIVKIIQKATQISKEIINLHMNIKDFQKEKEIKISLFKITHEIKNPIAVIKGYLDMFNPNDKIKSERYINIIKGEVERTLNLLNDFMEFSKIKLTKEKNDINILIDDVKDVLIPFFITKNVSYSFEVEPNIIVDIDYKRMKQVILNIIKNAVEACEKDKGKVLTTVFKDNDFVCIYVKDNGCGISKEVLDNILVPFYTTKEKGTGLGVSLSKEIINAHGGNISYSSETGVGTICKIVIPLLSKQNGI